MLCYGKSTLGNSYSITIDITLNYAKVSECRFFLSLSAQREDEAYCRHRLQEGDHPLDFFLVCVD